MSDRGSSHLASPPTNPTSTRASHITAWKIATPLFHLRAAIASVAHVPGDEWLLLGLLLSFELRLLPRATSRAPRLNAYRRGGRHYIGTSAQSTSCLHGAAAQTANRGQEGGGEGHAGRGRNAARWLSLLRALLLCWLPAALLHWRRTQRALASELSSGMPDEHDTALHSTRVQPIRLINLARAGADGPEPRRQVCISLCFLHRLPSFFRLTGGLEPDGTRG